MFVIWSDYIEVWVCRRTSNPCFIFIVVQEILPGNFTEPIVADSNNDHAMPAFTCLKLTIETLEQGVRYIQS